MKAEYVGIYLKLNKGADKDIIQRLNARENKQGYIKELIRIDASLDGLRHSYREIEEGDDNGQCDQDNTERKT